MAFARWLPPSWAASTRRSRSALRSNSGACSMALSSSPGLCASSAYARGTPSPTQPNSRTPRRPRKALRSRPMKVAPSDDVPGMSKPGVMDWHAIFSRSPGRRQGRQAPNPASQGTLSPRSHAAARPATLLRRTRSNPEQHPCFGHQTDGAGSEDSPGSPG